MSECNRRIVNISLDEHTVVRRNPDVEHERVVSIYDLLEHNSFAPIIDGTAADGPFDLHLSIEGGALILAVRGEANNLSARIGLPLTSFRKVIKDYFTVCENYFRAVKTRSPSRIEAIDMGRRHLHDEGAELLREQLVNKVEMDFDTARRLFTLICVLQFRQIHWQDTSDNSDLARYTPLPPDSEPGEKIEAAVDREIQAERPKEMRRDDNDTGIIFERLVARMLADKETVQGQAAGVRTAARALLAHYAEYRPNTQEEQKNVEKARILLNELVSGLDDFLTTLQRIETQEEAEQAGRALGETVLRTLEAWWENPAGAAAVKSSLGVIAVGALTLFGVPVSGNLAFSVIAGGIYGPEGVRKVITALRGSLQDTPTKDERNSRDTTLI